MIGNFVSDRHLLEAAEVPLNCALDGTIVEVTEMGSSGALSSSLGNTEGNVSERGGGKVACSINCYSGFTQNATPTNICSNKQTRAGGCKHVKKLSRDELKKRDECSETFGRVGTEAEAGHHVEESIDQVLERIEQGRGAGGQVLAGEGNIEDPHKLRATILAYEAEDLRGQSSRGEAEACDAGNYTPDQSSTPTDNQQAWQPDQGELSTNLSAHHSPACSVSDEISNETVGIDKDIICSDRRQTTEREENLWGFNGMEFEWKLPTSPMQVIACATAAVTANFCAKAPPSILNQKSKLWTHNLDRKRSIFNYPSLSNKSSNTVVTSTTSCLPSSSHSDALELSLEVYKEPLDIWSRRRSESCFRQPKRVSAPNLSLDGLRTLIKRNLVASLIGMYIIISLIIIMVLILPYLFDVGSANGKLTDGGLDQFNSIFNRTANLFPSERHKPNSSDKSTQTDILVGSLMSELELASGRDKSFRSGESKKEQVHRNKNKKRVAGLFGRTEPHEQSGKLLIYQQACQPLKVPFCNKELSSDDQGHYDRTMLPNIFGHGRQYQVERALIKYEPVLDIKCYPLLPLFLCSVYVPKCVTLNQLQVEELEAQNRSILMSSKVTGSNVIKNIDEETRDPVKGEHGQSKQTLNFRAQVIQHQQQQHAQLNLGNWSTLIPPCKSLCIEAIKKCRFFFEVLSLKLHEFIDCDLLPESQDPNVCVGQLERSALERSIDSQYCPNDKFRCSNGDCIPKKWRCDSFPDCTDKSDETNCSMCNADTQFYCGNNTCIQKLHVCNGMKDCKDGRDERQCLRLADSYEDALELPVQVRNESTRKSSTGTSQRLELWSATSNAWIPVCGSYWSPTIMSNAVCRVLGFSRARSTLILFGDSSNSSNVKLKIFEREKRSILVKAGSQIPNSANKLLEDSSTVVSTSDSRQQLMELVEDIDIYDSSIRLLNTSAGFKFKQPDEVCQFVDLKKKMTSAELRTLHASLPKHPSLTSMFVRGPRAGCEGKDSGWSSDVYVHCEDFQCGRPVANFIERIKLENSELYEQMRQQQQLQLRDATSRSALTGTSVINQNESVQIHRRRTLEATEEIEPEGYEEDLDSFGDVLEEWKEASEKQNSDSSGVVHSRIVGGIESLPGEFPYLAALHGGPDEIFFCGAVLVSVNWLVTASHCVGNRTKPDGWMVKVGITRRIASPAFVRKLTVRKIIKHPQFDQNIPFNNDIALILLDEQIEFNPYLRPICLPSPKLKLRSDNSRDCVVVGFGKSRYGQKADYLQVAHFVGVPIIRQSICSRWYAEQQINLTEGMLCAGYAEGKRDACQGDSGSGLFCRHASNNYFLLAGIVSFGVKCGTPKLPGVYTSVPAYVEWIEATTRENGYPLTHTIV